MRKKYLWLILALTFCSISATVHAASESELKEVLNNKTSEAISKFFYDDFDNDGNYEAFALIEKDELNFDEEFYYKLCEAWFVNDNGAVNLHNDAYYADSMTQIYNINGIKHVGFIEYYMGSNSETHVYGVENGKAINYFNTYGNLNQEGEQFLLLGKAYDAFYDANLDNFTGATYKPYYLYWDNNAKKYSEYGGVEMAQEQLKLFDGAAGIITNIEMDGNIIEEILYRCNGIININTRTAYGATGFSQNFYTLKYNDSKVYLDVSDSGRYLPALMPDIAEYGKLPLSAENVIGTMPLPLGIRITWQPSDNPNGYNIYRSTLSGEKGERINSNPVFGGEYIDANVDSNTTYHYTVSAISADGQADTPIGGGQIESKTGEITGGITGERGFILMQIGRETMIVNGEVVAIDPGRETAPLIKNGRTLLPIRAVIEAMNGSVDWRESDSKVAISALGHNLEMWLGRKELSVDGGSAVMDVPPEAINGRTMLPLRLVAENIGCLIEWIGTTKEVVIVYPLGK